MPDAVKLSFSGLMAPQAKSASRLRALISGLFGVRAEVEQFVGTRLMIEPGDRSHLGAKNSALGSDIVVGGAVYSIQDKVRIRIYTKSLADYTRFLPTGDRCAPLADTVFFYIGDQFEWEAELALPAGEAPPIRLGASGQVGWTTWLSPNWTSDRSLPLRRTLPSIGTGASAPELNARVPTMADISLEAVTGKLNRIGYETFIQALRQAKGAGNRNVELAHWMSHILQHNGTDLTRTVEHFNLDRAKMLMDIGEAIGGLRQRQTEMPEISDHVQEALDSGWYYATLLFGETQIRTGHILVGAFKKAETRRALTNLSREFGKINIDTLTDEHRTIWRNSEEENLRPMDGSGLRGADTPGAHDAAGPKGTTALDRFSQDLTEKAASGEMDPILGRDEEIRQIIDVLMRRRQNNPILTGEAGVGKTAVVEGFAQRVAAGDVPPPLRGVKVCALDIGLMQAGASMKGEFEQRLRSVIDEVQNSPTPIILFIDEAHTLIGAGGSAGTGDAANLLKPALARGTLRTIAATTWSEYRQYFEKDPALTRRFQPIQVGEPDVARCCDMLRGILAPMEKHHKVRISDAAIVAAVQLSHRYIPARQLPDKAVSLLDTACGARCDQPDRDACVG